MKGGRSLRLLEAVIESAAGVAGGSIAAAVARWCECRGGGCPTSPKTPSHFQVRKSRDVHFVALKKFTELNRVRSMDFGIFLPSVAEDFGSSVLPCLSLHLETLEITDG